MTILNILAIANLIGSVFLGSAVAIGYFFASNSERPSKIVFYIGATPVTVSMLFSIWVIVFGGQ